MTRSLPKLLAGATLGLVLAVGGPAVAQPPDQSDQPPGVEVQTRGPVHEAYATPAEAISQPGRTIDKQPPELIEEQPPDQKPEGDVQWMPGYWAWDDGRNDYLWVSGFWRVPPPSRTWVPGGWHQVPEGWQWTSGFWTNAGQTQMEYLPPPPASVENGPAVPQASADQMYVPGNWYYVNYHYVWRPGVWVSHRPGWVWVPSHYRWTPVGYVFVDGYWDFELRERGILFSPVWIDRRVAYRAGWYYQPTYVVYDDSLYGALFVGHGGYYFGNYFEARYTTLGYRSWFSVSIGVGVGYRYDPLFAYYSVRYRSDPHWGPGIREVYAARYAGDLPRPPVTIVNNTTIVNNINNTTIINKYPNINKSTNVTNITNVNNTVVNINKVANNTTVNNTTVNNNAPRTLPKLTTVTPQQKQQFVLAAKEVHTAAQDRSKQEALLRTQGGPPKIGQAPKAAAVALPKTITSAATNPATAAIKQPPPPAVKPHVSTPVTSNPPPHADPFTKPGTGTGPGNTGRPGGTFTPGTGSGTTPKPGTTPGATPGTLPKLPTTPSTNPPPKPGTNPPANPPKTNPPATIPPPKTGTNPPKDNPPKQPGLTSTPGSFGTPAGFSNNSSHQPVGFQRPGGSPPPVAPPSQPRPSNGQRPSDKDKDKTDK
ncbi:MAG: hypothetical protein ACJ8F7_08350 [Gemmataceae bacterium]